MTSLLEVNNLHVQFNTPDGVVNAVNGISYKVNQGETVGIVGESGCGKSVGVMSLMGLIPTPPGKIVEGSAVFNGQNLLKFSEDEIRSIRGNKISMIFQDPMTSLNPVLTIGDQIGESLEVHLKMSKKQARHRAVELLDLVGIPMAASRIHDYPHQFSGGMRQRAMIAMGLSCNPQLLIADEPTTALDVTIQAQIIDLVARIRDELGMAIIWITHDLGVVAGLAQRIIVMYAGYIVEEAPVRQLYKQPYHPYTKGLLGSLPRLDEDRPRKLKSIGGTPPDLIDLPSGCPFYARCSYRLPKCTEKMPPFQMMNKGHRVACQEEVLIVMSMERTY